jgi:small-conductance mechanosensitive channel
VARIVAFLSAAEGNFYTDTKKSGLGSWLLLIRISVITVGILIAFISAGIPVDRIVMIISALGVGIGFGMQTLVNNLISGVIIAFEKPVNLNDIVEIGGHTGKMKSIGIRSSVVTTYDGADLIIPNGDLLSQHLVNWTMGSARRRFELQVGVAYGTDLALVKSLIKEVLSNTKMILKNPEPMIWVTNFGDSSIDFSIKYWVGNFTYGNDVKSDLIMSINEIFALNNIVIPFPQRDIHIQPEIQNQKAEEKPE